MRKCKGCGAILQTTDQSKPGFTPKENSEYCQRCFRLIHYDDLQFSMRTGIAPDSVLNEIEKMDCLVLWVVDLFDFEAGMIPGLQRKIGNKDIVLVTSKRDILPETLSHEKIARFVFSRLKDFGISIKGLIITSKEGRLGVEEVKDAVKMYAKGRKVVVMGKANAGKSTLMNSLLGENVLTMSRYPGTTLEFNEIEMDGITYVDTPGIEIDSSILMEMKEDDLKTVVPAHTIKPMIYQVNKNQSFFLGGLARIDVMGCDHASAVFYVSNSVHIHRCKTENAENMWIKHYGELFKPTPVHNEFKSYSKHKDMDKMDIVIDGLGWICVSGQMQSIVVKAPKNVNVTFRKALL